MKMVSGRQYLHAACSVFSALLFVLVCAGPSFSADFLVTNTNDIGDGSFRKAISGANSSFETSTITFDSSVTGSITLSSDLPTIEYSLTISGPGKDILAVDGGGHKIFQITDDSDISVNISGLTIQNGYSSSEGGGIYNVSATLTLTDCTLKGNDADKSGGGIYNSTGNVSLSICTLEGNGGDGVIGGGIYNDKGILSLTDCTLAGNRGNSGAGIFNSYPEAILIVTSSTISGNIATTSGGGVWNGGQATLTNCTLSENYAAWYGGAIATFGDYEGEDIDEPTFALNLINCTVDGNTIETEDPTQESLGGGSIFLDGGASVFLLNSILSDGLPENCYFGPDGGGTITDQGGNIQYLGDSCGATISIADPMFGPLQDNGGLTLTHALLSGSPAIDNVQDGYCNVNRDQRGVSRPIDGNGSGTPLCDSGSYEYEVKYLPPLPDGAGNTAAVPTLSQWGMILLSLSMIGSAAWFIRRHNRTS